MLKVVLKEENVTEAVLNGLDLSTPLLVIGRDCEGYLNILVKYYDCVGMPKFQWTEVSCTLGIFSDMHETAKEAIKDFLEFDDTHEVYKFESMAEMIEFLRDNSRTV